MATAKRPTAAPEPKAATETELATKLGMTTKQLRAARLTPISDTQRARLIGVKPGDMKVVATPVVLSPAKPLKGSSSLTLYSSLMVYPTWPAESGHALFNSRYPAAVSPGAQAAFMRINRGKQHLVEFYVSLYMNVAYKFRVFTYPLGDFQDVTIQGPKPSTVIVALAPPVDEITGPLELGASIQQRNDAGDDAGWMLQSVQVNAVG